MSEDTETYRDVGPAACAFCSLDKGRVAQGDAAGPRGGVRWVLPDKAAYWQSTEP